MDTNFEQVILTTLDQNNEIPNSREFANSLKVNHNDLVGALKSLEADFYIETQTSEVKVWNLTQEAQSNVQAGSPEYKLYQLIPNEGISKDELSKDNADLVKFGLQNGMKKKWFAMKDKSTIIKIAENVVDEDTEILKQIQQGNYDSIAKDVLDTLKKRKLISQETIKSFRVTKGKNFAVQRKKKAIDFTGEMISKGTWQNYDFKDFNFEAYGTPLNTGNLHPLLKVRQQFREILLEMGFEEMPTNQYVESSFWNFDSLFQPQQHPARDAHDTFFLSDPASTKIEEPEYLKKVKDMHEKGDEESIGWRYDWSEKESLKNIMRTHTTAVSARMLYKLAQEKEFQPKKFFSIDRVFRNENLDKTHLAEFHQIEGLVADRNLGLGHLKGIIREFFNKIGIKELWFKPAYNPYTEPSMEIYGYHPLLKKKIELGNSGIFRPEMLKPMGLPEDVNVIAWGLSLERPTMIQYNVENIRELFGHMVDIKTIKANPICCFK